MDPEPSSEEIPEALPVSEGRRPRAVCAHCGSHDMSRGLTLGLSAEVGQVGVKYEATGQFLGMALLGTEPLRMDLCNSCGTVSRIYVQTTDRKWS
jgi:hypothetical protein